MTNQLGALAKALIAAKSEMEPLIAAQTAKVQTKSGGSYSYSFAELSDVYRTCESVLGRHGIAILQNVWTSAETNYAVAETMLYHADSDQSFTGGHIEMPARGTPQEVGSAITYARRYSLVATVGLATQDDDGNAASNNHAEIQRKSAQRTNGTGKSTPSQTSKAQATTEPDRAHKAFHASGKELFGDLWDTARPMVIERYCNGKTPNNVRQSSNDLTADELSEITGTFKTAGKGWKTWIEETMATKQTA